jgi:predicted permease
MNTLSHSFRRLRKAPGFSAVAVLIIAICLGANLTIFSVIDALLLRPLPFPNEHELVTAYNTYPKAGVENDGASFTNYYERRGQIPAFSSISIIRPDTAIVGEAGATQRIETARVSPEFFATVGLPPVIGRGFAEDETTYQTDGVVILTNAYWRQHFDADPAILNRTLRIDGYDRKIVGVLSPTFRFLSSKAEVYVPLSSDPKSRGAQYRYSGNSITMVARLRPGVSLREAQSQIDAHNASVPDIADNKQVIEAGFRSVVGRLHDEHVKSIRPTLLLLQAGVLLLLVIGAVNLINLLLIRASSRARELAIRQSMGATRRHIIGETMVETTLLALAGGVGGLLLAAFGVDLVRSLGAERLPLGSLIVFNTRVALAALLGACGLGVVIALPIAWINLRGHLANALQSASRSSTATHAAQRMRHVFITTQIALAFILLSGAGLLGVSLRRAMEVAPGFRRDHVLSSALTLPWKHYGNTAARLAFAEKLTSELSHQPGVTAVGLSSRLPLNGESGKSAINVVGHVAAAGEILRANYAYAVTGDYFSAMGIPLQSGRFLTTDDSRRTERACVVDADLARHYWPKGDALGQRLFPGSRPGAESEAFTVVGIVGAVKHEDLTEHDALGAVYFPLAFRFELQLYLVVRSQQAPESLAATIRDVIHRLDPELPLNDVRTMDARISDSLVARRSPALLSAIFASVALLLAAVGTYGVLSYAVAQRQREIGIRMALGAQAAQIARQFLSLGLRLLGLGTGIGIIGAWIAGLAIQTVLFGVPPLHLATLAATALALCTVTLVACFLPARRAAKVDPIVALRAE